MSEIPKTSLLRKTDLSVMLPQLTAISIAFRDITPKVNAVLGLFHTFCS